MKSDAERWLITGASGQLGSHLIRQLAGDPHAPTLLALVGRGSTGTPGVHEERVDLADADGLRRCVERFRPTHVLHVGAMSAVADCHERPYDAERINAEATRVLAQVAAAGGARLVYTSTDMVFAGDAAPYRETDRPRPLSIYGRTKLEGEQAVAVFDRSLVVRLPLMYGFPLSTRETTFTKQIAALRRGEPLKLFGDEFRTPVWLSDAAAALIGLARSELAGLIHVAGPERLSRYELIEGCARLLGIESPRLAAVSRNSIASPEPRPADLSLDGARFARLLPELAPRPVRPAVFAC